MDRAEGDAVVIMDADLQDPPEVVNDMIEKWREGYDVVYGQRTVRHGESWFKLATAAGFYRVLRLLIPIEIPLDAGDFRLLNPLPPELPFWTALSFNQCENCPLKPAESPHCPVAVQLVSVIERLERVVSYDQVRVDVQFSGPNRMQYSNARGADFSASVPLRIEGAPSGSNGPKGTLGGQGES